MGRFCERCDGFEVACVFDDPIYRGCISSTAAPSAPDPMPQFAPELRSTRRPVRVHVRRRPETGQLYLDYFLAGRRFRRPMDLADSAANRRRAEREATAFGAQLTLGLGWPEGVVPRDAEVTFGQFAATWQADMAPRWRPRTWETVAGLVRNQLLPRLGDRALQAITSAELYALRRDLCEPRPDSGRLSPKTVNEALRLAGRILAEAARRHGIVLDLDGLKVVEQPKQEVVPCTGLDNVQLPFQEQAGLIAYARIEGVDKKLRVERFLDFRFGGSFNEVVDI